MPKIAKPTLPSLAAMSAVMLSAFAAPIRADEVPKLFMAGLGMGTTLPRTMAEGFVGGALHLPYLAYADFSLGYGPGADGIGTRFDVSAGYPLPLWETTVKDAVTISEKTRGSVTTITYVPTEVDARRVLIPFATTRNMFGHGPFEPVTSGNVPRESHNRKRLGTYSNFGAGLKFYQIWNSEETENGVTQRLWGISGWSAMYLYSPMEAADGDNKAISQNGWWVTYQSISRIGKIRAPFIMGFGVEPSWGFGLEFTFLWPMVKF